MLMLKCPTQHSIHLLIFAVERKRVFYLESYFFSRSQWARGLRHKLSSPAQTLGSWFRIPLGAQLSGWVYSIFVLSGV
jgi:hypothetical protein